MQIKDEEMLWSEISISILITNLQHIIETEIAILQNPKTVGCVKRIIIVCVSFHVFRVKCPMIELAVSLEYLIST